MSKIKVSVIIPIYNAEKYLAECLDSILNQTLQDIEIICVNDGSRDHSLDILDKYAKKDARVVVTTQENSGQSSARNAGMDMARGEYISFVDSDDYIDITMLEKLYNTAKIADCDIAICDLWLNYVDSGELAYYRNPMVLTFLKHKNFNICEYPEILTFIGVWDRIYKRSFVNKYNIRFPVGLIYEDHLFTFQAIVQSQKNVVVNERLYYYRKNAGDSITDREAKNDQFKFDFMEISRRSMDFLRQMNAYEIFQKEYLYYLFLNVAMHQYNATTYKSFKRIFNEMRNLLDDSDYKVISEFDNPSIIAYANVIRKNRLKKHYLYIRLRRYFGSKRGGFMP